jgi:ligand-binding SRPBCC domain-containing protein
VAGAATVATSCCGRLSASIRFELTTHIQAPPSISFDCARSIDLHLQSFAHTGETVVAGRREGLIELGEQVTWRARHFGFVHHHTARITAFDRPHHFRDSMVAGRFRRFEHDHFFAPVAGGTCMRDVVEFASPFGWLGRLVDRWVLRRYLLRLIGQRGEVIRRAAEQVVTNVCQQ